MDFGRWLSDRAAREYIRKGEVAKLRARTDITAEDWQRILNWQTLAGGVWAWRDALTPAWESFPPRWRRGVNHEAVRGIECVLFAGAR